MVLVMQQTRTLKRRVENWKLLIKVNGAPMLLTERKRVAVKKNARNGMTPFLQPLRPMPDENIGTTDKMTPATGILSAAAVQVQTDITNVPIPPASTRETRETNVLNRTVALILKNEAIEADLVTITVFCRSVTRPPRKTLRKRTENCAWYTTPIKTKKKAQRKSSMPSSMLTMFSATPPNAHRTTELFPVVVRFASRFQHTCDRSVRCD
mmetsp:Transcript_15795/g.32035  ORF Transcript_15795/g.32035 Transcript_15795/m.32035 type:complete len:210 (+) Transcript_15795:276-905(+)